MALLLALAGCTSTPQAEAKKTYTFWPPSPDEPRLQFLTSFKMSTDLEPAKSGLDELVYGKEPQEVLALKKPYGVAMWNGRIYICDLRSFNITILDLRNRKTLVMGVSGTDKLQSPTAIAIAPDGMKYVADLGRGMVLVFDAQDRHVGTFGHKDLKPVNVAVFQDQLYVCDFQLQKQRVEVWNRKTGELLRTIGEPGPDPGQFGMPLGLAVDKDGNVYVADVLKCTVQKFDPQGKLVTAFGDVSASVGGLIRPKHMAVDQDGIIYVVDAAFQNVQLFDQIGRVYTFFGGGGGYPGAMNLPAGICVDEDPADLDLFKAYVHPDFVPQRLIAVTNQFGDSKVSVYALGHLRPGKTIKDLAGQALRIETQPADYKPFPGTQPAGTQTAPAE